MSTKTYSPSPYVYSRAIVIDFRHGFIVIIIDDVHVPTVEYIHFIQIYCDVTVFDCSADLCESTAEAEGEVVAM